ncbi:RagB/SusD family nutrient uptake outer membrane protein [Nibrella viscosa]|uniref:RagB/SusD family nutrient uptake outer membrane protein n=1 Tax=Nibrella viscosa TaxID=1084524 RepID=A0ABP8JV17_9BACT
MKKIIARGAILSVLLTGIGISCKDQFLDVAPTGQLTVSNLNSLNGLEGLLIGAYAQLNGRGYSQTASSTNWVYGSIRGGEANKGSNPGDFNAITPFQRYEVLPNNGELNARWNNMYEGISRANAVLRAIANASSDVTAAAKQRISGEARFLRGHYYFELKRTFNMVPYVDETVDYGTGIEKVPNNVDIWPKIEADFRYAFDNLPEVQTAVGRVNKWAAGAYLGKVFLYQQKFTEAKNIFDQVIANGKTSNGTKYALVTNYASLFTGENEVNSEIVFVTSNVANAGSSDAASGDLNLNWPYNTGPAGPVGCCGFFQPSFDFANSFRTNANGLPIDQAQANGAYDRPENELKTDMGLASSEPFTPDTRPVDPRLDHTVGRRGIPYLDWVIFPGQDWIRDQPFGGPYQNKKYVYTKAGESRLADVSNWTKGWTGINVNLIRYADVLLMAAETEIEAGSLTKALEYVNMVRARAANPINFVKLPNGQNAANYVINPYPASAFATKEAAREAVRFERKLELGTEGHRYFDLLRWGLAAPVLNAYLAYESKKLPGGFAGAQFSPNQDEYLPIPQTQIDIQGANVLKQNPGY